MKTVLQIMGMAPVFGAVLNLKYTALYYQGYIKGGVILDMAIILSIISILIGLLPFFIKVEGKPLRIPSRLFSAFLIIGGIILLSSAIIGFPFDLRNIQSSAPSSNQNSNVDINGDNNNVTIYNGNNGDSTPSSTPEISPSGSFDKNTDDSAVESSTDVDNVTDNASYDNNSYIISAIS